MTSVLQAPTTTFSGLSSGIDTASIIASLTTAAQKPIKQLQATQTDQGNRLALWQQFNTTLASLQTAALALTQGTTFSAATGASTNTAAASFTATPNAVLGSHSLSITQLAQAQKVVSGTFASGSTALGKSGAFTLNGKTVNVIASDTLTDIAVKINNSGAGASASVVNVGPGDFRLTLTSQTTGTAGALSAANNGTGTVLNDLGFLSSTSAVRQSVTTPGGQTGAASLALTSATQTVATALGTGTGAAAGTVTINGTGVALDLNTDSLSAIADKINAAGISGVTAKVVAVPDASGSTGAGSKQQLEILGAGGAAPTFADASNVLSTLGVLQSGFTSQVAAATDAKFNLDGLDLTRSSNTVSDAIPGATFTLLAGATTSGTPPVTTPATTSLNVSQDTSSVVGAVQAFVTAYNAAQSFVNSQNTASAGQLGNDGSTGNVTTNPLFGDSTLNNIQSHLSSALNAVAGKTTLTSIGVTTGTDGALSLNTATLTAALQTNPTAVTSLFGQSGISTSSGVQFLGASTKTQNSSGAGFAVNITQAATQSVGTAGTAQTTASSQAETLTFGGGLFAAGVTLTVPPGSSLQDTVNQINGDSRLSGQIYASVDTATHALTLSSKAYGSGNTFSATSNLAAGAGNSGIGTGGITLTAGVDVQGTINGEAATGSGQTLTGKAGNAATEGLKLLITSTTTGALGNITLAHGVADNINNAVKQITDPTNGDVVGAENGLNAQITDAQNQINKLNDTVTQYTAYLTTLFSEMEQRVNALQSQGSAFTTSLTGVISNNGK